MLVIGLTLFIVSYPQYRPIGFLGLIVSAPLIGWARWILARREIGHSWWPLHLNSTPWKEMRNLKKRQRRENS